MSCPKKQSNQAVMHSALPFVFSIIPNRSSDSYSALSLFRAASNVRVEDIAGYGETRSAAR